MAKFNNSVKTSNHWVLTCCNILLLIITLYVILYILGYTNVNISHKEGMSSEPKKNAIELGIIAAGCIAVVVVGPSLSIISRKFFAMFDNSN